MVPILRVQEKPSKCHRLIYLNSFFRGRRSAAKRGRRGEGATKMRPGFPQAAPLPPFSSNTYRSKWKEGLLFFLFCPRLNKFPKGTSREKRATLSPSKCALKMATARLLQRISLPKAVPSRPRPGPTCPPPWGGLPALPARPGLSRQLWNSRQSSPAQDARNPAQDAHGPALAEADPAALPKHGAAHTRWGPLRAAGPGLVGRGDGFRQTCADLEALPRRAVPSSERCPGRTLSPLQNISPRSLTINKRCSKDDCL